MIIQLFKYKEISIFIWIEIVVTLKLSPQNELQGVTGYWETDAVLTESLHV